MILSCPKCRAALRTESLKGVAVDHCLRCDGIWFDAGELSRAVHCAMPPVSARGAATQTCPRCRGSMWRDRMGPVEIERCQNCNGVFLDGGEFAELRRGRTPIPRLPPRHSFTDEELNGRPRHSSLDPLLAGVLFGFFD